MELDSVRIFAGLESTHAILFFRSLDVSTSSIVNGLESTSTSASKQNDEFHNLFNVKSPDQPSRTESKPLNFQEKQKYVFFVIYFLLTMHLGGWKYFSIL